MEDIKTLTDTGRKTIPDKYDLNMNDLLTFVHMAKSMDADGLYEPITAAYLAGFEAGTRYSIEVGCGMNSEEITELLDALQTALSVSQCAEDSTAEEHIKHALSFVNGTLCTVKLTLEGAQTLCDNQDDPLQGGKHHG